MGPAEAVEVLSGPHALGRQGLAPVHPHAPEEVAGGDGEPRVWVSRERNWDGGLDLFRLAAEHVVLEAPLDAVGVDDVLGLAVAPRVRGNAVDAVVLGRSGVVLRVRDRGAERAGTVVAEARD